VKFEWVVSVIAMRDEEAISIKQEIIEEDASKLIRLNKFFN